MASNYETFWQLHSYAVVGNTGKRNFPLLTYRGLKKMGKRVFPVDPSTHEIDGDQTFSDLPHLPEKVEAVVLEVPKDDTYEWVKKVVEIKIPHLWIHMSRDTPEAVALAKENGINVRHGSCGVMYLTPGLTYHSIHKWVMKGIGKY